MKSSLLKIRFTTYYMCNMYRLLLINELSKLKSWQKDQSVEITHEFAFRHILSWIQGDWSLFNVEEGSVVIFDRFLKNMFEIIMIDYHAITLHNDLNDCKPITREKLSSIETCMKRMIIHDWNRNMLISCSFLFKTTSEKKEGVPFTFMHPDDDFRVETHARLHDQLIFPSFHTLCELINVFHQYITDSVLTCM